MSTIKYRFHVLGIPHTISNKDYVACAFTQKAVKFCEMMKARGHTIIHYGHEKSDVVCDEMVPVTNDEALFAAYGEYNWRKNFFKFDLNDAAYQEFYKNAIREIGIRKQKNDFLLCFWGWGHKAIADAHPDMLIVEPGIGYPSGHHAKYKVFESQSTYNAYYGLNSVARSNVLNWYDVVIPNYFDLREFEFREDKDDYYLCLGRIGEHKGVHIAIQATQAIGAKLVIAGQGSLQDMGYKSIPSHVEYVGHADLEKRKKLMSGARALFAATTYNEPFGGVHVEAMLSGTPVITTDWGAFAECNIHGLTGYRCRTFEHFTWAAENIWRINPYNCRDWAVSNFSMDKVAKMFEEYFYSIIKIFDGGNGWYEPNPGRTELDWLERKYPNHPNRTSPPEGWHIPKEEVFKEKFNYQFMDDEERPFAERLSQWVQNKFPTAEVIDIGAGSGVYIEELRKLGMTAQGYDIADPPFRPECVKVENMFDLDHPADVVICLEVAEHVDSILNQNVIDVMWKNCRPGGYVIWSAAVPGQGGVGHINCQPVSYWRQLAQEKGFELCHDLESDIHNYLVQGYAMGWFLNNKQIWRRPE